MTLIQHVFLRLLALRIWRPILIRFVIWCAAGDRLYLTEDASFVWVARHSALRLARMLLVTSDVDCAEVIGILSVFLGVPFLGNKKILFVFFLFFLLSAAR